MALLLDFVERDENGLASSLQSILNPYFVVSVARRPTIQSPGSPSAFIEVLSGRLSETDLSIVFLTVTPSLVLQNISVLGNLRNAAKVPVMLIIDKVRPSEILELLKQSDDFVVLPLRSEEVLPRALKLAGRFESKSTMRGQEATRERRGLIGESSVLVSQVDKIPQIARWTANVLITGETGTGKELYARAIHYSSSRAGQPFMPVNCGAIPSDLIENELFGHERGAFTSAVSLQTGLIEEANGGTLFLDEIDCLPVLAQVKLLRFLQEKEYRPLGSSKMRRANVRVIAASNVNLEEAVGHGKVRQDLFYRLNIISITLPPLRERREDIPILANHFLTRYSRECEKEIEGFSQEALHLLTVYHWPGNVRELEHAVERAIVLCDGRTIEISDLLLSNSDLDRRRESLQEAKAKEIARFEKNYIQGVLSICKGNITRAAQVAQKNRRAFWQLIQKHEIDVNRFKRAAS